MVFGGLNFVCVFVWTGENNGNHIRKKREKEEKSKLINFAYEFSCVVCIIKKEE